MSLGKWINQDIKLFRHSRKFFLIPMQSFTLTPPWSQAIIDLISVTVDKFSLFQNIIKTVSYTVYSFMNDFFYLSWSFWHLFMCYVCISVICPIEGVYHNLSPQLLELWIKLLWTFEYKLLYGHMFSFFLGKCQEVKLLDPIGKCVFNFIRNYQTFPS